MVRKVDGVLLVKTLTMTRKVRTLFNHVGMVADTDSWKDTMEKVSQGIKKQSNQAAARFKDEEDATE